MIEHNITSWNIPYMLYATCMNIFTYMHAFTCSVHLPRLVRATVTFMPAHAAKLRAKPHRDMPYRSMDHTAGVHSHPSCIASDHSITILRLPLTLPLTLQIYRLPLTRIPPWSDLQTTTDSTPSAGV